MVLGHVAGRQGSQHNMGVVVVVVVVVVMVVVTRRTWTIALTSSYSYM